MSVPALDPFITFFNGGARFKQVGILLALLLFWRGGLRMRLCLIFLGLALTVGDWAVIGTMKRTFARQRPYAALTEVRHITGKGDSGSMPSGHAANIVAATIVLATFYRRSRWIMVPVAFMVCFARVYSGVHYPSDVLVGATVAGLYTPALLWGVEWLWRNKAPLVASHWVERVPSLLRPELAKPRAEKSESSYVDSYNWTRLGWYLIAVTLIVRVAYLAAGKIELSEDEAYQWLWSKHLALSYYSKPPLIAYTQFLGTSIFGNTQLGIRWLAPVFASLNAGILFAFLCRMVNPRAAFFVIAAACVTPLLAVGATLMTIDALSVLFWTLGLVLVWRAVERDSTTDWLFTGIAIGFGLLAKYVAILEWVCVLLFLCVHAPARRQFARPGLYLAILVSLLAFLPVALWNQQHGWITLTHLNERSGLDQAWKFRPGFLIDFTLAEFGLLHPAFVILVAAAIVHFWKKRTALQTYLFCLGAPLFIGYWIYTIRARVQPNWIAPSILPLFALAASFWEPLWPSARRWLRPTLKWSFIFGAVAVAFLHDTNLAEKICGVALPAKYDPLARVRGWSTLTTAVQHERELAKADFIIGGHYGITSLVTFYTPETRRAPADNKLIYALATDRPVNQFYFWTNYLTRVGEDALFVQRAGEGVPAELTKQFETIEDLGERVTEYRERPYHKIHLYACRKLRPQALGERR